MPTYKARIRIRDSALIGDQEYTFNTYVTDGGLTADDGWERANEVAEALAGTVLPPNCVVYEVSIFNKDVVNGVQNRAVTIPGTRAITGAALPGWNVAIIQGSASSGARLHTWHLRIGLTEDDVDGQTLVSAVNDAINALTVAWNLVPLIHDKDGAPITDWIQSDLVHMRQLGWHRRVRPGFKRGWVPV
jgi:hypothetical protein